MTTHGDEEDHSVSGTLTEGAEAGTLLLLHGKMLFLTNSAKGNPLGGLYILITDILNYRWPLARASDAFAAVIPTVMQQYCPFRPLGSIGPSGFLQLALKFPPLNVDSSVSQ